MEMPVEVRFQELLLDMTHPHPLLVLLSVCRLPGHKGVVELYYRFWHRKYGEGCGSVVCAASPTREELFCLAKDVRDKMERR